MKFASLVSNDHCRELRELRCRTGVAQRRNKQATTNESKTTEWVKMQLGYGRGLHEEIYNG
eukprot:8778745-Pyramimonas_sp.AAC.1